jgi:hypothetical protein
VAAKVDATDEIIERPDETHPDPLPLVNKLDPRPDPEPARVGGTRAWEVSAAKAASGRAEVILAGPARVPTMHVDEEWDTTVADVAPHDLEKGPLPKLAPPTATSEAPPPKKPEAKPIARRTIPPNEAPRKTLGSIPGFTSAPNRPPPPSVAPPGPAINAPALHRTQSAPPPPRIAIAIAIAPSTPPPPMARLSREHEQAVPSKRPPLPPPKTFPPGNAASGHTLRPPADGFAAPASPPAAGFAAPAIMEGARSRPPPPPSRRPSAASPMDTSLPAFEVSEVSEISEISQVAEISEVSKPAPVSEGNGHGPPVGLPGDDANVETDRHRRAGSSLIPLLAAAVVLLFVVGAGIGAVVARSGKSEPHVRRFSALSALLVTWHDQATQIAAETQLAEESAKQEAALHQEAAKPPEPPPMQSASAQPSASAPPSISAPPPAPITPPKPVAAKPVPTTKPKPLPTTKPKPLPTKAAPETKKKSSGGEWWQKKF